MQAGRPELVARDVADSLRKLADTGAPLAATPVGLLSRERARLLGRRPGAGAEARRAHAAAVALGHVRGQTVLPLPPADALAGGASTEGLRLLEAAVEAWVRQVKPLLKADPGDAPRVRTQLLGLPVHQASASAAEASSCGQAAGAASGPLAELEFWARRAEDLAGVEAQLGAPAVARATAALEAARSTHAAALARSAHVSQSCMPCSQTGALH